jgi:Ca2+-binding EF-hand superfamily protein
MNKWLLMTLAVSTGLASTLALAQVAGQPAPQAKSSTPMQWMDANGDGVISKDEAAKYPRLAAAFDQIDTNKDGKLSADELAAWRKQAGASKPYKDPEDMQARRAARQAECFDKADTDKNGQLSRAEFAKLHEVCGPMGGGMQHGGMPRAQVPPAPSAPPAGK